MGTRREALLSLFAALFICCLAGFGQSASRTISGTVFYERGEPVRQAAVQLKDSSTLQIVSTLTDASGRYHFSGLSQDKDYEVSAVKGERRSSSHHVSRLSSRAVETVDLYLKSEREEK